MMDKKLNVWTPLLFAGVMIIGMFMGYRMRDNMPGKSFFFREKTTPLQEIITLLNKKYVDSVDIKALGDTAIQAMLSKLDPHSIYIPAAELQQVNEEINGSFFGIGIEFNIFDDSLHVINVLQGGPSDKAGLQTGDILISAGDSIVSGKKMTTEKIRSLLRGVQGSVIKLGLLRGNKKLNTEVARDIIPIKSVDAAYMINDTTGYIRLNKFSTQTYKEFMTALMDLKKQKMTKLVLDLRANGGGVLDQAIEIADEFLEGDKLITYTEGLHIEKKEYRCRRQGQFEKGILVVLADEGSASASEVLMGALQDWDRATIIGRKTFGKGLVQEQYDLSDKSALRLTVARYYTPIGRSIQRSYKNGGSAYYEEINHRFTDGEMISADSVKNDTTKIYKSVKGKKLYGGGGINPDYFIAADTGRIGVTSAKIYSRGILNDFGYKYFISHRSRLSAYKNASAFIKTFSVGEQEWSYFKSFAEKDSVSLNNITPKEKNFITGMMKSSIARQLFRAEGYFEALNAEDPFIKKSLEITK
jgi:carboxyl-terminal processing protease